MLSINQVYKDIQDAYEQLGTIDNILEPLYVAGHGKTRVITHFDPLTLFWNPYRLNLVADEALIEGEWNTSGSKSKPRKRMYLRKKRLEVKGSLNWMNFSARADYQDKTYVQSAEGLFSSTASKYPRVFEDNAGWFSRGRMQVWPNILLHYIRHGTLKGMPSNWDFLPDFDLAVDRSLKSVEGEGFINEEQAKLMKAMHSAMTFRKLNQNGVGYQSLIVLDSLDPFSSASPSGIQIEGSSLEVAYSEPEHFGSGDSETGTIEGKGTIKIDNPAGLYFFPTPCVMKSRHSEIPLTQSDIRRSDKWPRADDTRVLGPSDIYVENVDRIRIGRNPDQLWDNMFSLGPFLYSVVVPSIVVNLIVFGVLGPNIETALVATGATLPYLYMLKHAPIRVEGDGDMNVWLKAQQKLD